MRLHPRTLPVQHARHSISNAVVQAWQNFGLTPIEVVAILAQLTAEYSKYPLREERHPDDPNKKADEA